MKAFDSLNTFPSSSSCCASHTFAPPSSSSLEQWGKGAWKEGNPKGFTTVWVYRRIHKLSIREVTSAINMIIRILRSLSLCLFLPFLFQLGESLHTVLYYYYSSFPFPFAPPSVPCGIPLREGWQSLNNELDSTWTWLIGSRRGWRANLILNLSNSTTACTSVNSQNC